MSTLEIRPRESGPPSTEHLSPRNAVVAASIAVAIGAVVVLESIAAFHYSEYVRFPFAWTLAFLTMWAGLLFLGRMRDRLFQLRFELAIVALLVGGAFAGVGIGRLDPTDAAILGAGLVWLFATLVEQQPVRVPLVVVVLLLLFLACSVLSIANGGIGSILALRTMVNKLLLAIMLSTFCSSGDRWKFAARVLLAVALFSAVVALFTGVLHLTTGIVLTADNASSMQFKPTPFGRMLRVTAFSTTTQNLAHPLILAAAFVMCIPMRTWRRVACIAILGAAIGWTFSTGAYITFGVVVGFGMVLRRPEHSLHYITILAGVGCIAYITGALDLLYSHVLEPLGGKGVQDRAGYLNAGIRAIANHPVAGLGLRGASRVLRQQVHNAYFQSATEIGIAGAVVFTSLVAYLTAKSARLVAATRGTESQAWMKAILLGTIGLGTHLLTEPFYGNYMTWAFMGIVAGAVARHDRGTVVHRGPDEVECET